MRNFDEILAKIARDNGTTPEDVLHEMQVAIDNAYDHHDQEAQQLWDKMTFKGDRPTPEEFIFQVAMMLDKGNVMAVFEETQGNRIRMTDGAGQACFESPQSMKRNFRPFKNRTAVTKENAPGSAEIASQ